MPLQRVEFERLVLARGEAKFANGGRDNGRRLRDIGIVLERGGPAALDVAADALRDVGNGGVGQEVEIDVVRGLACGGGLVARECLGLRKQDAVMSIDHEQAHQRAGGCVVHRVLLEQANLALGLAELLLTTERVRHAKARLQREQPVLRIAFGGDLRKLCTTFLV